MIKIKITPARIAEACNIMEYLLLQAGNAETAIRIAPRFILGENDEYLVTIKLDADGDIESMEGLGDAMLKMTGVTPKRLGRLSHEFMEAANAIVNPPSGGDSNGLTSMDTKKPPPG